MIRGGEIRNVYEVWVGKHGRNGRLEDLGLDGGIISVLVSQKQDMRSCTRISGSGQGERGGLL